ncbi:MAG: hypothetical protein RL135_2067 [Bacteroidota bacterium]|jgi:hypothetical protein
MNIQLENLQLTPNLVEIRSCYEKARESAYRAQEFRLCWIS